ncbi:MAG: FliH/SctL family protein [Bacteriovoracaceae bacterium]
MANTPNKQTESDARYGEIQSYSFNELNSTATSSKVTEFKLPDLSQKLTTKIKVPDNVIRKEREHATQSNFKISSMVKEHRGIVKQEEEDYQIRVETEVEKRLQTIQEEAYQAGYNAGLELGSKQAYEESITSYQEKCALFESYIEEVKTYQKDLCKNQREDIYKMIKLLTKWVLLKEVKNDQYMKDLFEKLILELNTKSNLLVKVNAEHFEKMPEVLELIQQRLGKLTNVRLEIEPDLNLPGIIIESENGIIDGSLEAQFANLDKLFLSVGIDVEAPIATKE